MSDRILLLSYNFPPMWTPEALLSAKRMGNVPGFTVDVLCAAPFGQWGGDHSLDKYVTERFDSIERLEMPSWSFRIPRRFQLIVRTPDEFRFLNHRALSHVRSLPLASYTAMVTWSQWHSVHLVGLAARHLPGAPPWIAHFSDPWVSNPLDRMDGLRARANRSLEHKVVDGADRLLFTSAEALKLTLDPYGSSTTAKSSVLPHAFEPSLYPPAREDRSGPIVLRYLGAFYGARSPEPLFRALGVIGSQQPERLTNVRVELVGRIQPEMLETRVARALPEGLVQSLPAVDYVDSLRLAREADILLVIDAPMSASPFLPSKLVDYVGAARPVLGITPPGPAASLIRRLGGWLSDPSDIDGTVRALLEALDWLRSDARNDEFGDPAVRTQYSADSVGAQMAQVIRSLSEPARELALRT